MTDDQNRLSVGIEDMTKFIPDRLLTPKQVAARFAVDPKTVTRWAKLGKIPSIKTPGGHRRYRETVIDELAKERVEPQRPSTEY